jgi:type VI secretion system protein ImpC
VKTIESIIAEIDKKLTEQINKILHHEDYQKLESAWRGLHYLVNNTETDEMLKIRVMNASKADLARSLKRYKGTNWDQSPLFKKVYEAEYGQLGGEPFGCLVGDYYFDQSPPDVELLGELSKNAAAAHCPFISGTSPSLMQMDSWQELANPRDLTKIFQTPEYAAWRSLRESDDAKYVGLAMPRFLARLPYGAKTNPVEEFNFEEETDSGSHNRYNWANAAYAMASTSPRRSSSTAGAPPSAGSSPAARCPNLPVHAFPTDDGGIDSKCPTEIAISDRREAELAKNGLMPLVHRKNSDFRRLHRRAVALQAERVPGRRRHREREPRRAPAVHVRVCRFAHFLKCMVRDKIGSFKSAATCSATCRSGSPSTSTATRRPPRRRPRRSARWRRRDRGRGGRGQPRLLHVEVLPQAALPARGSVGVPAADLEASFREGGLIPQ